MADGIKAVPSKPPAVCLLYEAGQIHEGNCCGSYHATPWRSETVLGQAELAAALQTLSRYQDHDRGQIPRVPLLMDTSRSPQGEVKSLCTALRRPAPPQTCKTANLTARGSDDSGAEGKRQTEGMLEAPALRLKIDKKGDKIRYFS